MDRITRLVIILGALALLLEGLSGSSLTAQLNWRVPDTDSGTILELLAIYYWDAQRVRARSATSQ